MIRSEGFFNSTNTLEFIQQKLPELTLRKRVFEAFAFILRGLMFVIKFAVGRVVSCASDDCHTLDCKL